MGLSPSRHGDQKPMDSTTTIKGEVVSELVTTFTEHGKLLEKLLQSSKESQGHLEPSEQEIWNDISSELFNTCQGRCNIPEYVTPFHEASKIDIGQQRVDATIHIQDIIKEKRTGEAVAAFRAARKVWPESNQFDSEDISPEDELIALKKICMTILPKRHCHVEPSEQELKELWYDISSEVYNICQGRCNIPEYVAPFHEASNIDVGQQRVDAMIHIKDIMKEKKTGKAVAAFRAAREVWPDHSQFGSADISPQDELKALKKIFMTSLPNTDTSEAGTEPQKKIIIEGQDISELKNLHLRHARDVKSLNLTDAEIERLPQLLQMQIRKPNSDSGKSKSTQEERKPPLMIQIYYVHKGDTIQQIEEELTATLKSQYRAYISFINRRKHSDIDASQILIVLCIEISRTEADAENAIKDIKNHSNAALVMVHKQEMHVRLQLRSDEILTDPMFEDLGGIFDLAFTTERGIYPCKMNDNALKGISTFIRKTQSRALRNNVN